jgi:hypothetical protein
MIGGTAQEQASFRSEYVVISVTFPRPAVKVSKREFSQGILGDVRSVEDWIRWQETRQEQLGQQTQYLDQRNKRQRRCHGVRRIRVRILHDI